ncbi:hypothetical protein TRVL_05523 [Trypanosoma vivax]|nr:hypothetical protein TRVL_05523 [Trypanosoma vivax]
MEKNINRDANNARCDGIAMKCLFQLPFALQSTCKNRAGAKATVAATKEVCVRVRDEGVWKESKKGSSMGDKSLKKDQSHGIPVGFPISVVTVQVKGGTFGDGEGTGRRRSRQKERERKGGDSILKVRATHKYARSNQWKLDAGTKQVNRYKQVQGTSNTPLRTYARLCVCVCAHQLPSNSTLPPLPNQTVSLFPSFFIF